MPMDMSVQGPALLLASWRLYWAMPVTCSQLTEISVWLLIVTSGVMDGGVGLVISTLLDGLLSSPHP